MKRRGRCSAFVSSVAGLLCLAGGAGAAQDSTSSTSVIDVAVFYTPNAMELAGGRAEVETLIDLAVAETNLAYETSGVKQRVALVAVEEVPGYSGLPTPAWNRDELRYLRGTTDGHMDDVHRIRDRVGADVVVLVSDSINGVAFRTAATSIHFARYAFAVVNGHPLTITRLFAHELGHVMGLRHDRYVACGAVTGDCSYSLSDVHPSGFGYVNQRLFAPGAPETARWKTVMAYSDQCFEAGLHCRDLLRFSNPRQTYPGSGGRSAGQGRRRHVDGGTRAGRRRLGLEPDAPQRIQLPDAVDGVLRRRGVRGGRGRRRGDGDGAPEHGARPAHSHTACVGRCDGRLGGRLRDAVERAVLGPRDGAHVHGHSRRRPRRRRRRVGNARLRTSVAGRRQRRQPGRSRGDAVRQRHHGTRPADADRSRGGRQRGDPDVERSVGRGRPARWLSGRVPVPDRRWPGPPGEKQKPEDPRGGDDAVSPWRRASAGRGDTRLLPS